ncbi:hypothetical protein BH23VER1_BH23VER1_11440 [soil metagenome]
MSIRYKAVTWNRQKKVYDTVLAASVALFLAVFLAFTFIRIPTVTAEIALIRAFGTAAILLLHVILVTGPLARIDPRFLPLLYNRRHMGVTCFLLALAHAALVVATYHAGGNLNPILSIFADGDIGDPQRFPFQAFGFAALFVLFLMAATSHDFWLANLTAPVWKSLHMAVYLAYACLVVHVAFGALQAERSTLYPLVTGAGIAAVAALHLVAGFRGRKLDQPAPGAAGTGGWIPVCRADEIPEGRATIATVSGERVAVFKHEGKILAVSNVCQHQNGPLGEGRIVDGCITCPWHGYQYDPATGASPPPFTESVPTFNARVEQGTVFIDPSPNPPIAPPSSADTAQHL